MVKFLSKIFSRKNKKKTLYNKIITDGLGTIKTEYRCNNCKMIISTDYPYCPFCGLKAVNSSYTFHF